MKIKFNKSIDYDKFIVEYEIIPNCYIAKIVNKTKTYLNDKDVFIFNTYKELEDYFKSSS